MFKKGSHAFCCFVDFTKVFDYVFDLLFSKLFESSSVVKLWQCTRLLAYNDIIQAITRMNVDCCVGGSMFNLLCFADDMVLIAPSWDGLQLLIDNLYILRMKLICLLTLVRHYVWCLIHQFLERL